MMFKFLLFLALIGYCIFAEAQFKGLEGLGFGLLFIGFLGGSK